MWNNGAALTGFIYYFARRQIQLAATGTKKAKKKINWFPCAHFKLNFIDSRPKLGFMKKQQAAY